MHQACELGDARGVSELLRLGANPRITQRSGSCMVQLPHWILLNGGVVATAVIYGPSSACWSATARSKLRCCTKPVAIAHSMTTTRAEVMMGTTQRMS